VPTSLPGLPAAITVYEVGARDGLQNESALVPTATKAELIRRLVAAGSTVVEATSFVHPKWVPQLADAAELLGAIGAPPEGVRFPVLVPNLRGLDRAKDAGVRDIAVFASATESFARRNLNSTVEGSLTAFADVVKAALAAGMRVRGYVSMCFGDPWEGAVDPARVVSVTERLLDMGCYEISLGDTIGVATGGQVRDLLGLLGARTRLDQLAVHFHDTYGQALANTLVALQAGITVVDASAGGLGGCPFAGSATGNLATEDLVWMLNGLGIASGLDLDALVATSSWLAGEMGRPSPSAVVRALAGRAAPDEAAEAAVIP
jgi:hydroxymethylglutaryl-CoA lyase